MAELKSGSTIGGYTIWHRANFDPATKLNANANAVSSSKLATARTIAATGDGTWSVSFDGTTNTTATLTLASTGVTAGTYKAVTVDVKGRVTTGLALTTGLVTSTTSAGTSNVNTTNTNTYLNVVETVGASTSSVGTSTQIIGAGTVTVTSDTGGKLTITGAQNITGNAGTATKLATARTINGVSFNGTANITVADATKLPLSGGTLTGTFAATAIGITNTVQTNGVGISLYGGANAGMPGYGIAFSGTATFGTHGDVTSDWATYFTMNGATSRGWIFKSGNAAGGNIASISAAGAFQCNGAIVAGGDITAFSDARLKTEIEKIANAVDKIKQLNGYTYTRIDSGKRQTGLIAQELEKVLPEAVVQGADYKSVAYGNIVGLLVEAIKELENRIAVLECK